MDEKEKLAQHVKAVPAYLNDKRMVDVLGQIPDLNRRLLCLHRYIRILDKRNGKWVDDHWAFTKDDYKEWQKTDDFKLRGREIKAIQDRFTHSNKGYKLIAGSKFRPLAKQIDNWNENKSVRLNSEAYFNMALTELKKPSYCGLDTFLDTRNPKCTESEVTSIQSFYKFLNRDYRPKPSLMVATPGFSNHGTGLAIDFVVKKSDGTVIVSATDASKWTSSGWAEKLASAMRGAAHFNGPLKTPNEPWHWTFDPD